MRAFYRLFALAGLLAHSPAFAEDPEITRTQLYDQAATEIDLGHYAEAARLLDVVNRIRIAPKSLIAWAWVEKQRGKFATAKTLYARALNDASKQGLADDEQVAREMLASVTSHVPVLDLGLLPAGIDATVEIDRNPLHTELGKPIELDPGLHTLRIQANGYHEFSQEMTLQEGEKRALTVELFQINKIAPTSADEKFPVGPIVLGAAGLVTAIAGAALAIAGKGAEGGAGCADGVCRAHSQTALDDLRANNDSAERMILAGWVTGGIGVAAIGGAAAWWASSGKTRKASVKVTLGVNTMYVQGCF